MSLIAPTLQSFFTDRLAKQRQASAHTVASYRDTLRLLLAFMQQRTSKPASRLGWEDLDATAVCAFLDHLETDRGNSPRTRNARLTAIRSLFAYACLSHPEHAELIARVLAIPPKRFDKATVSFLTAAEVDALLAAPDRSRWEGRRDHALMLVATQTGLRVSELIGLDCGDVALGTGAHVRCEGKGRKQRAVPLTSPTQAVLRVWLAERRSGPDEPLFSTRTGRRLSRDAVERRVATHAATAAAGCPSLHGKRLSPHVLRHTNAMSLLHAGVDATVIALWLGHADVRSTNAYLHADLSIKERALAMAAPTESPPGATARPTRCSPSSKACDYADLRDDRTPEKPSATRIPRPDVTTRRHNPRVSIRACAKTPEHDIPRIAATSGHISAVTSPTPKGHARGRAAIMPDRGTGGRAARQARPTQAGRIPGTSTPLRPARVRQTGPDRQTGISYADAADHRASATTTIRRRRDQRQAAGLGDLLLQIALDGYDRMIGLELDDLAADGWPTKAPCGGEAAGPSPADRDKQGLKRSVATEGKGVPIGAVPAPANRHDSPLLAPTLDTLKPPGPLPDDPTVHPDAAYDSAAARAELDSRGMAGEIAHKGLPAPIQAGERWVVERTHAWMNHFKKLSRCNERRKSCVELFLALVMAVIVVRCLIREAKVLYRW